MKNQISISKPKSIEKGDLLEWRNKKGEPLSYLVVRLVNKLEDREVWECLHEGKLVNIFMMNDFTRPVDSE
jgi:hypothetical protein